MRGEKFMLVVLTTPVIFAGEAGILQGLLGSGLERLHIRKPGADVDAVEGLIRQVPATWRSRLVLHGTAEVRELAGRYGIPQVHGPVEFADGKTVGGRRMSGGGRPVVTMERMPGGSVAESEGGVTRGAVVAMEGMAVSTSVHSFEE